jgi:uncharacterized protein
MILINKYQNLIEIINRYKKPLIALSGGLDSLFLSYAVSKSASKGCTITLVSDLFSNSEIERAANFSDKFQLRNIKFDIGEKHLKVVANNPKLRCYDCKKLLFSSVKDYAIEYDFDVIFDGTTFDDLDKYRPGLKAKDELGVVSPLALAEITKSELRKLAEHFDLEFAQLPSFSCFATRFPYNAKITKEKVLRVAKAEEFLRKHGFNQVRVRDHNDIARIEVYSADLAKFLGETRAEISQFLKSLGFKYVTLDLDGFISGSMDRE